MRTISLREVAGLALVCGLAAATALTMTQAPDAVAGPKRRKAHRARLDAPQDGTLRRARGTVRLIRAKRPAKRQADSLKIRVRRLDPDATYSLLCDDPATPFDPSAREFATATTNRRGVLKLVLGRGGEPLPHDATADDLSGLRIEVRDEEGGLAVEGLVPGPQKALQVTPGCVLRDVHVMADDFDGESTGQEPVNWTVTGTGTTGQSVLVDDTVADGGSGNSVAIVDTEQTTTDGPAMARRFRAQTDKMAVEFTLISGNSDGQVAMTLGEGTSSGVTVPTGFGDGLGFHADGQIGFGSGAGIQDYEADTAYAFRVEIDLVAGFMDVLIDGDRVVEDRDLGATNATIDVITFATGADPTGSANVDSVRVFEVEEDCPPSADAGSDQTVECTGTRTAVHLDGTGSSDPEGRDLLYGWTGPFVERTATGAEPTVHFAMLGTHSVELTVSDGFHRSAPDVVLITLQDTTPPNITAPADIEVECASHTGNVVDLGTPEVADLCDPTPAVTNDAPARFQLGTTTVTWTATDASGNAATAQQIVTVVDTTPPAITAPADIEVECASHDGNVVDLGAPTVVDLCDPAPAITNDAPARFQLGTTVVTWTATDASGNSATAEQSVTVVDTTPPDLSITDVPAQLWPPNHQMIDIEATIDLSDLCDPDPALVVSVTSNEPDNGTGDGNTTGDIVIHSPYHVAVRAERAGNGSGRRYTIVWTATDGSGNETTVTKIVRVPHSN